MNIQQRIADILQEHSMLECSWGTEPDSCACGYDAPDPPKRTTPGWEWAEERRGWYTHVAGVLLSLPGIAIMDADEALRRLRYNSHDLGEFGTFIRLEYASQILADAEQAGERDGD